MSDRRCAHCNGPIDAHGRGTSGRGRPPKYCSRKCLDDSRTAISSAQRKAKRQGRVCEWCGSPIGPAMNARTRCCSRECGWKLNNKQRVAQRTAARRARLRHCAFCGQPVPDTRHAGAIYCSPEHKKRAQDAKWRAKSPGYMRQYLYGLTEEQYQAMLASQGGVCAICRTDTWHGKGNRPHVDHDPAIGPKAVRGILCGACNNGLGNFGDDPARLRAAADYLEAARVLI
jgi:hypothetical protein